MLSSKVLIKSELSKLKDIELTKLYYSIGEVADIFGVNASLIRFWEKEFPSISPKKNKKGNRLFTVQDIHKIDAIYILVKEKGFTLEGAKKALKSRKKTDETYHSEPELKDELIPRLEAIRDQLKGMKSNLD